MRYFKQTLVLALVLALSGGSDMAFAKSPCFAKLGRYVVSDKVDLKGKELSLADKTILVVEKDGGFYNGTISGNNLKIVAPDNPVFSSSVVTRFANTNLKSCWYEDLLTCITKNDRCAIEIADGDYSINNPIYVKITNSLKGKGNVTIKHANSFTVGDDVTIEGISWDGQDKAEYWMYCQPNHLTIRNCTFQNYYGKSAGIVYWSHSERDTEGLLIENCTFGKVGAKENGVIGDMEGGSTAIYTYRCNDIKIRNNKFIDQYGSEDSDAIKLEGERIDAPDNFPIRLGDSYRYANVNARVEGNVFVNVPKSPIKIFASGVTVINNKMDYSNPVKTAMVRMFRGQNIIIKNNTCETSSSVSNIIQVHACKSVSIYQNSFISTSILGEVFGELVIINNSDGANLEGLIVIFNTSSKNNRNQALLRLSGNNITIRKSSFKVPYTYYGIYAPFGIENIEINNLKLIIDGASQYLLAINKSKDGEFCNVVIENSKFSVAPNRINDEPSYSSVFANCISIKNCDFNYNKGVKLEAAKISVKDSRIFGLNIYNATNVLIDGVDFTGTYSPIVIGDLDDYSNLTVKNVKVNDPGLSLIRFKDNVPGGFYLGKITCTTPLDDKLFYFDRIESFQIFHNRFGDKMLK